MKKKIAVLIIILCLAAVLQGCITIQLSKPADPVTTVTYRTSQSVTGDEMSAIVKILQNRISGYSGASAQAVSDNEITITVPEATAALIDFDELGRAGTVYFIMQYTGDSTRPNYTYDTSSCEYILSDTIDKLQSNGSIILTEKDILNCTAGYQKASNDNTPCVTCTFTEKGSEAFAKASISAYENGWSIGIYYNDRFISVPMFNSAITSGEAIITGFDSYAQAQATASCLKYILPTELTIVN